jgi:uncharacterized membrane protein AbrB (regulator of aidB expression)
MPKNPGQKAIGQQIMALVLGAISGVLAYYLGLPLPWMLGSMIGTTVAAPSGATKQPKSEPPRVARRLFRLSQTTGGVGRNSRVTQCIM